MFLSHFLNWCITFNIMNLPEHIKNQHKGQCYTCYSWVSFHSVSLNLTSTVSACDGLATHLLCTPPFTQWQVGYASLELLLSVSELPYETLQSTCFWKGKMRCTNSVAPKCNTLNNWLCSYQCWSELKLINTYNCCRQLKWDWKLMKHFSIELKSKKFAQLKVCRFFFWTSVKRALQWRVLVVVTISSRWIHLPPLLILNNMWCKLSHEKWQDGKKWNSVFKIVEKST